MLTLEVRFLTGRYAAAQFDDRRLPEWPPHPARLYSALVAAVHEAPSPSAAEREALTWLAAAGAPEIHAPEARARQQREAYVPTNDVTALSNIDMHIDRLAEAQEAAAKASPGRDKERKEKKVTRLLAKLQERSKATARADGKGTPKNAAEVLDSRNRQARYFPVALPWSERVLMRWPGDAPQQVVEALDRVAARVARLGHSSSLVSVRVAGGPSASPAPGEDLVLWRPDPQGEALVRVPMEGQLELLEEAHERHKQEGPRTLPADFAPYTRESQPQREERSVASSWFSPNAWIVFRVVAPPGQRRLQLQLSLAQKVARAMRGTLHKAVDARLPEPLLGHKRDGSPSEAPHLAIVPLPDVGHPHASGAILGLALVPPAHMNDASRRELLRAVGEAERQARASHSELGGDGDGPNVLEPATLALNLGRNGRLLLRRETGPSATKALRVSRWTAPSKRWTTVTAIALDRNPGKLSSPNPRVVERAVDHAEQTISQACVNIGLPRPRAAWIHLGPVVNGPPPARRFMPFPSDGHGPRRVCVHAELLFDEPVQGPVLLGAGRYLGLGLCAPGGGFR